jgi:transcriptional regulator with XRE-family HTH domain
VGGECSVLWGSASAKEPAGRRAGSSPAAGRAAEIEALGRRIRARRGERRVTLDVLAARTGFSKGYLSRIENGRKTPPLETLSRIARALGTDINQLLAGEHGGAADARPFFSVVRAGSRQRVDRPDASCGYAYERLTTGDAPLQMQPYLIRLPREFDSLARSEHRGQEFMHVLRGRVEWEIGGELLVLDPGDSVYLDSRIPHRARALDGEAEALVVVTPRQAQAATLADDASRAPA